jgi:excisionase family DNA binding protein
MTQKLLTVDDICEMLEIGKTTAYQLVKNIKHVKIGRRILVPEDEIQSYIQSQMSTEQ